MAKTKLLSFLESVTKSKYFPLLVGLCAGLYPIFFYYSNNFALINTWGHFLYFLSTFLILPAILCMVAWNIFSIASLKKWQPYVLPFLGIFIFLFLLKICLYAGVQRKIIVGILIVSILLAKFLTSHFNKIIVLQLLIAGLGFLKMVPTVYHQLTLSTEWLEPVDDIASLKLAKKPNIYFIQPDGYVNFSELSKGYYQLDASEMEGFLENHNFVQFADFRTNYGSTLSSNSATFMMQHHYYNKSKSFSEGLNARDIIISDNTTLSILKNNGYHTNLILQKPYLLVNKPKMGFDYSNIKLSDFPYISTGLDFNKDVVEDLKFAINQPKEQPAFYFVEFFNPGHISYKPVGDDTVASEKAKWIETLAVGDKMLKELVNLITELDSEALVIILADHGGYVGLNSTSETVIKTTDRDLIYSMFSAQLSIRSPYEIPEKYNKHLKTSVNVFRVLFSFLADDESYLNNLQYDGSYMIIKQGAPKGVYKYIDQTGNIVFEKVSNE